VFRGRRAINIRKPVSKEKILSLEEKKGNTPKIINFSFCSHAPRSKDEKLKLYLPSRLNFVEMVQTKYLDERTVRRESISHNRVVMDLSDAHFRKTFTYNLRERP
jgi:hypothetical protein